MTRYLLDTNIVSDVFRHPRGRVDAALRRHRDDEIGTSLIVAGEILFGLNKNRNLRGLERLRMFLDSITVWPLESPVEHAYAELRSATVRAGISIGPNDMWIAAHATVLGATLITDDKAFWNVPGLTVENWLRL